MTIAHSGRALRRQYVLEGPNCFVSAFTVGLDIPVLVVQIQALSSPSATT